MFQTHENPSLIEKNMKIKTDKNIGFYSLST